MTTNNGRYAIAIDRYWIMLLVLGIFFLVRATLLPMWMGSQEPPDPAQIPNRTPLLAMDPNQSDAMHLSLLPGVGPVLSRQIIADREQSGPIDDLEQMNRTRGFGPKTLQRCRPYLSLPPKSDTRP
ncbi:MAG: helix-hairpin-helix domain-containing protein [Planctomycetota bacterium]